MLGTGSGAYKMKHGSFKITDKLMNFKPVSEYKLLENKSGKIAILFDGKLTVTFCETGTRLEILFQCSDDCVNRLQFSLHASREEHIYGCGEQYSKLDLRGQKVPVWCEEQGIGRGKNLLTFLAELTHGAGGNYFTTYFPQPTFVSSLNYYCHVETYGYSVFDFTAKDRHTLFTFGIPDKIIIEKRDTAPEVLESLTQYLGRQPELPDWVYDGVWLGIQGGRAVVESKLKNVLETGMKVAAVWAQDWEGIRTTSFGKQLRWDWKYDEGLYPDLPCFIKGLNEQGIKFLGYINPFLCLDGELYKEASDKGYLVKNREGGEYYVYVTTFPAATVDLSNPEAVAWIKNVIRKNMIETGLSGWMADFGEHLPVDSAVYSGESGESFHNKYPVRWAETNREVLEETGNLGNIVFFTRSGFSGTGRFSTLVWAGDQMVDWSMNDSLASVIPAGLSLGFSGIGFSHSDIGGYTTVAWVKRSKELFLRWAEHAVFTAIMRTHEGNRPGSNWQFDSDRETLAHFSRMSRIHFHLKPYIKRTVQEYVEHGVPVMRHPYIHYEKDENLHKLTYQYMFGRDMMIAPVYKPGRRSWRVYLPDDRWMHMCTGKEYKKGWHRISSPIGQPPAFYRAQSEFCKLFEAVIHI